MLPLWSLSLLCLLAGASYGKLSLDFTSQFFICLFIAQVDLNKLVFFKEIETVLIHCTYIKGKECFIFQLTFEIYLLLLFYHWIVCQLVVVDLVQRVNKVVLMDTG